MHDIARLFRQEFGCQLRDLGLTEPQWRALGSVFRFPGIAQSQLAGLLGIGRAPVGKLVDRLESENLIERVQAPGDRRSKLLRVTAAGKPVASQIRRRYRKFQVQLLQGLDEQSVSELEASLGALYTTLSGRTAEELLPGQEKATLMLLISIISRLNSRQFDLQLKRLGFTRNQWLVLVAISRRQGLQQSQLARELKMNKAPLGTVIDQLQADNRVERRPAPNDRRAHELFLTDDCRAGLRSLAQEFEDVHEQAVAALSQRRRLQLSKSLESIRQQLKHNARDPQAPAVETKP